MTDSTIICPYCKNNAYFDPRSSSSYCRSKICNGIVIEQGKITYENEVNLHEADEPGKKQTRFGGYENKRDAFKNQICEMLGKSDSKQRKQFYEKFEAGEHQIQKLSSIFMMNEAFTNDAISKYRSLMFDNASDIANKSFLALAALAYNLTIKERKSQRNYDERLNKITIELIVKFCQVTPQQMDLVTKALNMKNSGEPGKQDICQKIVQKVKEHKLPFNELENMAIYDIPHRLMDNSIIRGEKTSTIACVVEYMVSQLSGNPELNRLTLDQLAQMNDVTKDTAKKLWNTILENQCLQNHITRWQGQRSISELKHIT
ncbi:unnamed protein product [Paramecium octaurelia]|uniref:Uncharacterized protein n=1 Tax=Paramecium octaurelia TaxID=43137 RepID=A0A8S1RXZ3_PAROT|nr:unnamed protein product [Paramecium octaurelia]